MDKKALDVNLKLFQFLAELQNNMHVFTLDKKLDLCKAANVRLLHDSQYVSEEIDKNEYTHLIQKYSEEWMELIKQSLITDGTISDALGINGSKSLKRHHKNFIMDDYDDEMFQQKSKEDYEIDRISTISSLFMGGLLPSCAILYEEGCSFVKGKKQPTLLSCSPIGVIR